MFTGIIKDLGTIESLKKERDNLVATIKSKLQFEIDDSVAINGVCSTVVRTDGKTFTVEYMPETIKVTDISKWKQGDKVNLEPPLSLGDKLNGHFVQGHVDSTAKIIKIQNNEITIAFPREFSKYIALKGSISVDGISLTISNLSENAFTVSLIPHTLENTTLGFKKPKDLVNMEVDMISRYLKQLFDERDHQTNYEFLKERGFI
jgi:riboflavin synthase